MPDTLERAISSLSIHSTDSQPEDDWDRSLTIESAGSSSNSSSQATVSLLRSTTPRNSIVFPADDTPGRATRYSSDEGVPERIMVGGKAGGRTLSELLRLHSEKGTQGLFSPEEASRIADVLGQWINASSSPYEGDADDDFFARAQAQDDLSFGSLPSRRPESALAGRPRGRSESSSSKLSVSVGGSGNSRPPSSLGASRMGS